MAWEMWNDVLRSVDGPTSIFLAWTSQIMVVTLAVVIVAGVAVCFFGLKLIRILSALAGLAFGALAGLAVLSGFELSGIMVLVVILVCAAVLAVLCVAVRKFGAFVFVFLTTAGAAASLLWPRTWVLAGICLAAGLLLAVLAVIKTEAVVVFITGISGGMSAGIALSVITGLNGKIWWTGYAAGAVLSFIGIWTQFMMQSRKIGKKEEVYAKQVRQEVSRESEVERARQILEDDEEDNDSVHEEKEENEDDITIISEDL